jgi:hypothetical protein
MPRKYEKIIIQRVLVVQVQKVAPVQWQTQLYTLSPQHRIVFCFCVDSILSLPLRNCWIFQQLLTVFSSCWLFSATAELFQQLMKKSSNWWNGFASVAKLIFGENVISMSAGIHHIGDIKCERNDKNSGPTDTGPRVILLQWILPGLAGVFLVHYKYGHKEKVKLLLVLQIFSCKCVPEYQPQTTVPDTAVGRTALSRVPGRETPPLLVQAPVIQFEYKTRTDRGSFKHTQA